MEVGIVRRVGQEAVSRLSREGYRKPESGGDERVGFLGHPPRSNEIVVRLETLREAK